MAGSNRSGDLADAQKSIPVGTLAAQMTTSVVCILLEKIFSKKLDPSFEFSCVLYPYVLYPTDSGLLGSFTHFTCCLWVGVYQVFHRLTLVKRFTRKLSILHVKTNGTILADAKGLM